MADFIDRQATLNAVGLTTDAINFNPTKYVDAQGNELVAVVRCKECQYYAEGRKYCDYDVPSEPNGFCSWAERREDATD